MLDINQTISNAHHADSDPEGYLFSLDHWSPQLARQLATRERLQLDAEEQWQVIYYLRERYRTHGNGDHARVILRELEQRFATNEGNSHLYQLFPRGPVSQGSRLAGLPEPPHAHDLSFGSTM
jgi:TusE/DsrC/DsvC family sulfur relay protein